MTEEWRDIAGYEGFYQVSNLGRVRSADRLINTVYGAKRRMYGRVLKPKLNKSRGDYCVVFLSVDGVAKNRYVHQLVLEAFIGPRPGPNYQCCHADRNPQNNRLDNLRWDTPANNTADKLLHGTTGKGERSGTAKLTDKDILVIRERAKTEIHRVIAADYGVKRQAIDRIVNKTRWSHI